VKLLGNLDCEARWAGVALPEAVRRRISLYATLFAACAPDETSDAREPDGHDASAGNGGHGVEEAHTHRNRVSAPHEIWVPSLVDPAGDGRHVMGEAHTHRNRVSTPHEIWVPAPVDPARLVAHPGWAPPIVRTGEPPRSFDLMWADPAAKDANDRSRALAIAQSLGVALPGACVVASLAELEAHVAGWIRSDDRPWICKARWTAAGRDRARGVGRRVDGELRARLARLFERFGPLVLEPWMDRIADIGVCGDIAVGGEITLAEPHRLLTDPRGGFLGIDLAPVDRAIAEPLRATAHAAATAVAIQTAYRGPFAIDAFVYRDSTGQHLHPLCELNARHTFGWIAHALARRLGIRRLGFDAPPTGATVLIAPGADRITAWCA